MKKFAKISVITAGIMGVLGCLLCLIAVLGGGWNVVSYANSSYIMERMEGKSGLTRSLLRFAGLAAENGSDGGSGIVTGRLRVNGKDAGTNTVEEQIDISHVKKLSLSLGAGSFIVSEKETGDGESIDLSIRGKGECDFHVEDETLCVSGFKGNHSVGRNQNSITLGLPRGMKFEEVEIEMGAGVMDCYDIKARELEATVGAGALSLYRSQVQELSVELGAGELCASEMEAEEAQIMVGLGSCSYEGEISHSLEMECNMGNGDFLLTGKETDFNYEIECSGGTITIGGYDAAGLSMERRIDHGARREIELTCNMGNIDIQFTE